MFRSTMKSHQGTLVVAGTHISIDAQLKLQISSTPRLLAESVHMCQELRIDTLLLQCLSTV